MDLRSANITIVGATGAVGREFLDILTARGCDPSAMKLLASARSAGTTIEHAGRTLSIGEANPDAFGGIDVAFFSAGGGVSRELAPAAVRAGAVVVDNSSAFRMDPDTALVVPEINPDAVREKSGPRIIANPNCSTIIMMVAVHPLRELAGVERIAVSTYQAVSGAGAAGMTELDRQTRGVIAGEAVERRMFGEPCAFNVFSHDSQVDPATGRNVEEQKMIDEPRKMWGDPGLRVSATCVRVPVMRAHSEAISVELSRPATEAEVRAALAAGAGLRVVDDRDANAFPTPLKASGGDDVLVGRIRGDESLGVEDVGGEKAFHGFDLFVCGDQIRKGAALNAVQIAELI